MNLEQQNKLAMYLAVKAVCDANKLVWQTTPAFAEGYADFSTHLKYIRQPLPEPDRNLGGNKLEAQQIMCQAAITVAAAIRAYAVKTKNAVVAGAINFSIADFMRATDAESARRCQSLHDLADTSLTYLEPYGVTAAKLGMLQSAIIAFNAIETQRQTKAVGHNATSNLSDIFDGADKALNQVLDHLIEQFQFTNEKFVRDYQMARTVGDVPAGQQEGSRSSGHAAAR